MSAAKGKWIAFLDGDDLWDEHFLSTMLSASREFPDAEYINSNFFYLEDGQLSLKTAVSPIWARYFEFEDGQVKYRRISDPVGVFLANDVLSKTGIVLLKRTLIDSVGFFDEDILVGEDVLLWLKLAKKATFIVTVSAPLMQYRIRPGSLTNTGVPLHTLYGERLLKRLLISPDFRAYSKLLRARIGESVLRNSYYFREQRRFTLALNHALQSVYFTPNRTAAWKNLLACLLMRS